MSTRAPASLPRALPHGQGKAPTCPSSPTPIRARSRPAGRLRGQRLRRQATQGDSYRTSAALSADPDRRIGLTPSQVLRNFPALAWVASSASSIATPCGSRRPDRLRGPGGCWPRPAYCICRIARAKAPSLIAAAAASLRMSATFTDAASASARISTCPPSPEGCAPQEGAGKSAIVARATKAKDDRLLREQSPEGLHYHMLKNPTVSPLLMWILPQ